MNLRNLAIAAGIAGASILTYLLIPDANADRVDTIYSSSAVVSHVTIIRLPSGGAMLESCGRALKADGGVGVQSCVRKELSGANQTTALNFLNGPCLTIWKNNEGL